MKIMSEQENDNLENFFKERAHHHNLEFDERDWLLLEKQLDKEMPIVRPFWSWLGKYWAIPLLLILLPSGWYSYNFIYKSVEESRLQIDEIELNSNQELILNKEESELSTKDGQHSAEINNSFYEDSYKNQEKEKQNEISPLKSKNNQDALQVQERSEPNLGSEKLGYVGFENGALVDEGIRENGLHFISPIVPVNVLTTPEYPEIMEKTSTNEILPNRKKESGVSVGIGYSPDFSTVGIGHFISPGARWKFLAAYSISNRFYINTGIDWVNNKYEAYGEDYHAPPRYWRKGIEADEAYGECQMVDIPLNVRYNIFLKGNNRLFISGGASTYFLLKEDYYFSYYQEDPELPTHWGTDKMTIYPFGIINFSLGYQLQLSGKSSIQVEPFIKIPTTGIGWGKVDLHTLGIYFMYRYKIGK